MMFQNRQEAGRLLAEKLSEYKNLSGAIVIGIPRGGLIVARAVADALQLSLDIIIVKKISASKNPELALGAIGPKEVIYWDENLCKQLGILGNEKLKMKDKALQEQKERENLLRGTKAPLDILGKTVILVDDGVATGATVLCAQKFLHRQKAKTIILAIPIISKETLDTVSSYFDCVIALSVKKNFYAVGQFYQDFPQVTDEQVKKLL